MSSNSPTAAPSDTGAVPHAPGLRRYLRASRWFVGYTIGVILWGAFVRASLSGDGCGDHWPLCNGEVVPVDPSIETMIELTHRVTSGFAWIFALVFVVWSRRVFPKAHRARLGATLGLVFMSTEALVGAGLVIFKMVADNPETGRGYWSATHLLNTFVLLWALTAHVWWASGRTTLWPRGRSGAAIKLVLVLLLLLSVTGAIAALGNTLFPVDTIAEGIAQDLDPSSHLFLRLRVFHPILAVGAGAVTMVFATFVASRHRLRLGHAVAGLVVLQLGLGLLNLTLHAPTWLQLVHLLLADVLWIGVVWLGGQVAEAEAEPPPVSAL